MLLANSFRVLTSLNRTTICPCFTTHEIPCGLISVLPVRWRKPRWVPKAQSKEFYVRKEKTVYPGEEEDLRQYYAHYRTTVRSLRHYINETVGKTIGKTVDRTEEMRAEEDEHRRMMELNARWNDEISQQRAVREKARLAAAEELMLERLAGREVAVLEAQRLADAVVSHEMGRLESFITEENLDSKLSEALEQQFDYNFALDTDGTVLKRGQSSSDQEPVIEAVEHEQQAKAS